VTRSIQNYREALEEMGHEVYIVAPKPKQKDFVDNDDHVIRLPSVNSYVFDKRPVSLLYPGIARKLYGRFDIVHSQTQFYLGIIAGMVAKHDRIPHFTTVHTLYTELLDDYPLAITAGLIAVSIGFPFVFKTKPILPFSSAREIRELSQLETNEIKKKQGWRLMAAMINQDDVCIAPSQHLANTLQENGTTIPIHVMPNGISLDDYYNSSAADSPLKKSPDETFIICVARVSGEKRQRVLVEMMPLIENLHVKLILVGDGPERENLERRADELSVGDRIIFTGLQSPATVAALMKQADVFTLPSYRFDNQPMVFLEAIASGLPIVYCDDNMTEGLTPDNALLTDGIEAEDFAATFNALLPDVKRMKRMSEASVHVSKQFDRRQLAKRLLDYYEAAIVSQAVLHDS
jgi:glycosyltransferase involved in cell wall biosynthesis